MKENPRIQHWSVKKFWDAKDPQNDQDNREICMLGPHLGDQNMDLGKFDKSSDKDPKIFKTSVSANQYSGVCFYQV